MLLLNRNLFKKRIVQLFLFNFVTVQEGFVHWTGIPSKHMDIGQLLPKHVNLNALQLRPMAMPSKEVQG